MGSPWEMDISNGTREKGEGDGRVRKGPCLYKGPFLGF
jgi:hypothetical protein